MSLGKSDANHAWMGIAAALITAVASIIVALIQIDKSGEPTEPEMEIKDVSLQIADIGSNEAYYTVNCPITVRLIGNIAVTSRGTVLYRFVRIPGLNRPEEAGAVRTVTFDAPGNSQVLDEVTINIPKGEVYVGELIEIVHPANKRSNQVDIRVHCDETYPEGPPGPPPNFENPP